MKKSKSEIRELLMKDRECGNCRYPVQKDNDERLPVILEELLKFNLPDGQCEVKLYTGRNPGRILRVENSGFTRRLYTVEENIKESYNRSYTFIGFIDPSEKEFRLNGDLSSQYKPKFENWYGYNTGISEDFNSLIAYYLVDIMKSWKYHCKSLDKIND